MTYVLLKSFVKQFDRYGQVEQQAILETVERITRYFETGEAPYGLRIKKLSSRIYEGRVNINLRIAVFREPEIVKFFCLGNHDDIQRCLRSFR